MWFLNISSCNSNKKSSPLLGWTQIRYGQVKDFLQRWPLGDIQNFADLTLILWVPFCHLEACPHKGRQWLDTSRWALAHCSLSVSSLPFECLDEVENQLVWCVSFLTWIAKQGILMRLWGICFPCLAELPELPQSFKQLISFLKICCHPSIPNCIIPEQLINSELGVWE